MKKLLIFSFLLSLVVLLASCGASKKINTAIAKKDSTETVVVNNGHADSMAFINNVFSEIKKKNIDFNTFSAKMKVDYWDKNGKGPDLTVFVRIQKDSVIWLSINATLFSYEAFRVMITPDSVIMIDKKNKLVQFRSVEYLRDIIKLPLDFYTLQDIIIGNPVFLDSNIVSYRKDGDDVALLSVGDYFRHQLNCNIANYQLRHSKLDEVSMLRNLTCDLTYNDYEKNGTIDFSKLRQVTVVDKNKLDVNMEIKQYGFNESLNYPFSIPKNFKRE